MNRVMGVSQTFGFVGSHRELVVKFPLGKYVDKTATAGATGSEYVHLCCNRGEQEQNEGRAEFEGAQGAEWEKFVPKSYPYSLFAKSCQRRER